jgi:hypothetical protein
MSMVVQATVRVCVLSFALALSACAAPGPPTWPTQRDAARTARRAGLDPAPAWARDVIESLNEPEDGRHGALISRLAFRFQPPDAQRMFTTASRKLDELGEPAGIVESRVHREADREWFTALIVHGKGHQRRLVLYQIARDGEALARIFIRTHWFRDAVTAPADDYVSVNRFRFPGKGRWVVIQGGRTREDNKHHDHRSQRFAYDVLIKQSGSSRPTGPRENERYYAHGQPIVAPAPGTVVFARDGEPETEPGEKGKGGGNGVIIDHGFGEYSALWHMIPGSVTVKVGDHVEWGRELGRVGNSGRSTQPHIHFHVACGPPGSDPFGLPAELRDLYVDGKWQRSAMPRKRQRIEAHEDHPRPGSPREGSTIILDW